MGEYTYEGASVGKAALRALQSDSPQSGGHGYLQQGSQAQAAAGVTFRDDCACPGVSRADSEGAWVAVCSASCEETRQAPAFEAFQSELADTRRFHPAATDAMRQWAARMGSDEY